MKLKHCMILKENDCNTYLYIEVVKDDRILLTVIDRDLDYQSQEWVENNEDLQKILLDYTLIN